MALRCQRRRSCSPCHISTFPSGCTNIYSKCYSVYYGPARPLTPRSNSCRCRAAPLSDKHLAAALFSAWGGQLITAPAATDGGRGALHAEVITGHAMGLEKERRGRDHLAPSELLIGSEVGTFLLDEESTNELKGVDVEVKVAFASSSSFFLI